MTPSRVAIRDGLLQFNGRAVIPFGGEVQYFRVRDPQGDPVRTHEIWRETLDRMAAAGMNHVTTYVPWDWHEEEEGKFRWDGDRDLDKFLALAYARGFVVGLKPGPFITAEWPRGFGSCGAVPAWFRTKFPGSLVKNRRGRPWSFDPLGGGDQTQPRYDAPEFMDATRRWFAAVAPIVRRYVFERPCIALLQLDNETNFWWSDLAQLDVPGDYNHRQEVIRWYLATLKHAWGELGIEDGDVVFTVNDSPFAIPGRQNLLADGPRKNSVALLTLDSYPKGLPFGAAPADQPFQASYFIRLFESHSGREFAYAAEIQAMNLKMKFGLEAKSDPRATGVLLAQMFGSGLKGGALYVMREGLNADGTLYGPACPIAIHGDATARWEVVAPFARFVARHGMALAKAGHETKIAIVTHRAHQSETGEKGRLWSVEAPGVFGWLRMAGYDPAVVDLDDVGATGLENFAALVCLRADLFPPEALAWMDAAAAGGATVLKLMDGTDPRWWGRRVPLMEDGIFEMPAATALSILPGAAGPVRVTGERRRIGGEGEVFLRAADGEPLGEIDRNGWGRTIRIGASFTSEYDRPAFYTLDDSELRMRRAMAHALLAPLLPSIRLDSPRVEAWRRGAFLFLVNHGQATEACVEGLRPCRCALTGGKRDPRRIALPEHGYAVLHEGDWPKA